MNGEIRELLTNYGKVDIVWFDSYGKGDLVNFWNVGATFDLIKSLQPDILVNNRLAVLADYNKQPEPYLGDFDTPEQRIGAFQMSRAWESCMSILKTKDGGGWSYRPDGTVRSYQECMTALLSCVVGDGNLLLDVGPNPLGQIPDDQAQRLSQMGTWLQQYGRSIYNTRGGPLISGTWGGSTYRLNTVYLHLFPVTTGTLHLPPLENKVVRSQVLTEGRATVGQTDAGLDVTVDAHAENAPEMIIELTLDHAFATAQQPGI
jgi:alpha-L-fucosidase